MRYEELFERSMNKNCIVVDVQPAYVATGNGFDAPQWVYKMMEFLNNQRGSILAFVNAEQEGLTEDTVDDIRAFWEDAGFLDWDRVIVVDKGYGFFRSWMDLDMSEASIIKTIRLMYQNKVNDSRQLFGGEDSDDYEINFKAFLGGDYQDFVLDEPLIVEWTSVAQLKKFSGSYIMGGGRNECLREVELLMNAFNIKYKRIEEFVYG